MSTEYLESTGTEIIVAVEPVGTEPLQGADRRLTIEYWPLSRLIPYVGNPRKNDAAVDQMVASIRELGFAIPLLAVGATGELIDGHLRLKGGAKFGMQEFPVIPCDGWTAPQIRAFRLMANRSVAWDATLLEAEFKALEISSFDLKLTGFNSREIDGFTVHAPAAEDERPAPAAASISLCGDVWLLGDHRLLCGDATDQADVLKAIGFRKPFLMVTDPPYGVSYDSDWRLRAGIDKPHQTLADGKVSNDDRCDWSPAWKLFPGTVAYVWHSGLHSAAVQSSLEAAGFALRAQLIWAKKSLVIGRGHYHWQHEACWYASRGAAHWSGDRKQSTLWAIDNMHTSQGNVDDGKTVHSTQKPVECMRRPILNHTKPGDVVYDPFAGSGTTLIAAETTGRVCISIEIDPVYVDVIVERWQKLTGKAATLEGSGGVSFEQVKFGRRLGQQDAIKEHAEEILEARA